MQTFTSHDGRQVTAQTPAEAMLLLWGALKPLKRPTPRSKACDSHHSNCEHTTIGAPGYTGYGLRD